MFNFNFIDMESQELFNTMMENAIVYLQEKGYIPTQPTMVEQQSQQQRIDWSNPDQVAKETKILRERGLLPRK